MTELNLDELKQEAEELGISFQKNIGAERLKEKIDKYYESQETSGKEIQKAVEAKEAKAEEQSEEKSVETGNKLGDKIAAARDKAMKTRVITIIDNDQRVNNQTTSCKVNCSNMYFDLGTVVLPLNMPVEVRQGHINTLKEVKIPQHVKDPKTGLSAVRMVPKYTISYDDIN